MSFPVLIHGTDSLVFQSQTATQGPNTPLGTKLILQDGRCFRYALKSGAAAAAGDLQQAAANISNHINLTASVNAILEDDPVVTIGNTLIAQNEYQDGVFLVETGPGNGYTYKIGAHDAVAANGVFTAKLAAGHQLKVALTTSSTVSLIHSPYRNVVVCPTTLTQIPVGVATWAIAASVYSWLQTHGECAVNTQGTLVLGNAAVPSGTTAGAVSPQPGDVLPVIGFVQRVAATTLTSLVFLTIDG